MQYVLKGSGIYSMFIVWNVRVSLIPSLRPNPAYLITSSDTKHTKEASMQVLTFCPRPILLQRTDLNQVDNGQQLNQRRYTYYSSACIDRRYARLTTNHLQRSSSRLISMCSW